MPVLVQPLPANPGVAPISTVFGASLRADKKTSPFPEAARRIWNGNCGSYDTTITKTRMKAKILMAVLACLALFASCDKQIVSHTGDDTGNLYGIWQLDKKTETESQSSGDQTKETDFSNIHFYLAISNAGVPHALAKKGSFTELANSTVYDMELNGTFDVLELTSGSFVIQQKNALGVTVTYAFKKVQTQ